MEKASDWFAANLGADVPWHFTAFHPDYKMLDKPCTPLATLTRARAIARAKGLRYVYAGNVHDREGSSTWCPGCGQRVVERDWFDLGEWGLEGNRCNHCGFTIAGHFDIMPGRWGGRRLPVRLSAMERK
jgi:pyruvate formate lyase activating enzyme